MKFNSLNIQLFLFYANFLPYLLIELRLLDLRTEVVRLGGQVEEGTRITGKFFRVWMDVKAALTGNNRSVILDSCEFGEDKALLTYKDALENRDDISPEYVALIQKQLTALQADYDKVKALRDAEKNS